MSEAVTETPTLAEFGPAERGASPAPTSASCWTFRWSSPSSCGRTRMTIRETMALTPGSVVVLDRTAGEPVDLLVNGRRIARGEVVAIDEEFGLRITEVTAPEQRALDAATSSD